MRRWLVLASTILLIVGTLARAEEPFRNAEGETALQVALRAGKRAEVMSLLTETQAAYFETFTRGPHEPTHPLPQESLDRAWHLLAGLMREHPRVPELNFVIGVLSVKRNDLARAELAFERVIQISPDNHRAGVELARVCTLSGRHDVARRTYEHVLAQDPPENVARKIKRQLAEIDRQGKRFHVSVRLDAGAIHDDNVNVGPSSDTVAVSPISMGPYVFTELSVDRESQPVDTSGAYAAATVETLYDFGQSGGWGAAADLNYYENWLDEQEYESRLVRVALGVKHASGKGIFKGVVRAARIWDGPDPLVDTVGIMPAYLRIFKPGGHRLYWVSALLAEHREYDTRNTYDGLYLGLEQTARLMLTDNTSVFAGLRVADNNADAAIFSYTGLSGVAGATVIWGRLNLSASARYTRNEHDAREVLAPRDRVDERLQLNAKATLRLFGKTGLELKHQYTDNASTFELYDYDRNVTMLGYWGRF